VTYSLHPAAEQDIAEALDFYTEQAGLVVAGRFVTEFERVAELLIRHPDFGTPTTRGRRIFPLQVFPYSGIQLCIEALKAAFESWWSGISIGSPALVAVGGRHNTLARQRASTPFKRGCGHGNAGGCPSCQLLGVSLNERHVKKCTRASEG
jgi:toxin ParE1/3/4